MDWIISMKVGFRRRGLDHPVGKRRSLITPWSIKYIISPTSFEFLASRSGFQAIIPSASPSF
jgi:hypothetical protein